jgi:hypothetical protein
MGMRNKNGIACAVQGRGRRYLFGSPAHRQWLPPVVAASLLRWWFLPSHVHQAYSCWCAAWWLGHEDLWEATGRGICMRVNWAGPLLYTSWAITYPILGF